MTDSTHLKLHLRLAEHMGSFPLYVFCYDAGFHLVAESRQNWEQDMDSLCLDLATDTTWEEGKSYQVVFVANRLPYAVMQIRIVNGMPDYQVRPLDENDSLYWFVANWEEGKNNRWKEARALPSSDKIFSRLCQLYHHWQKKSHMYGSA